MDDRVRLFHRLGLPVSERRLLMAAGDLVAVNVAILIALRVWSIVGERAFGWPFIREQIAWFPLLSALWLLLASANDYYNLALSANWLLSQGRLVVTTVQLVVVYLVIFFLSPRDALPRLFILYYAVSSYVLIALWRLARPFMIGWAPLKQRVVVVGTGWPARTIVDAIRAHAPGDYEILGVVTEGKAPHPEGNQVDVPVLGSGADLRRIVEADRVGEVVLASTGNLEGELFQAIMDCYEMGVRLVPMPLLYEQLTNMVPVEYVGGHWNVVLPLEGRSPFDPYPALKRGIDIVFSLVGLAVFGLLLPVIALAMAADSPGPVFYSQERVGRAGKVFKVVKLRTMVPDAEARSGPIWAVQDDPRITRLGRLMRRSRLDEAPQLINILKGEMSLIGPRPERPFFVEHLHRTIPFYRTRLAIRPGVTGWAQVNYGYGATDQDQLNKLKYDLYYIRHRSLVLDALILLRTVGQVIRLRGQ
jgi:exopolysaccharide biosynthesis polyprenyl glycosylphosphotransferase